MASKLTFFLCEKSNLAWFSVGIVSEMFFMREIEIDRVHAEVNFFQV